VDIDHVTLCVNADTTTNPHAPAASVPKWTPNILRGGEETSSPFDFGVQVQIASLARLDPNAARAKELEMAGDLKRAKRVLSCENPDPTQPFWRCRIRGCPRCSQRNEKRYRKKAAAGMRKMQHRLFVLVSLRSLSADVQSLTSTIRAIGKRFERLKRRKCFRAVRGGVGGREVQLTHDGSGWNVHLHLVLDAAPEQFDADEVDRVWRTLTNSLGSVRIHQVPEVKSIDLVASYVTKHSTWSPPPGRMNPNLLRDILDGIRGRRLFLSWGSGRHSPPAAGAGPRSCGAA
jgi:hypothetical protein